MTIPIYVISLKRSVERQENTVKQLHQLGLQASFFDAIEGESLDVQELVKNYGRQILENKFFLKRPLLLGEIGCSMSHLNLYQKMIDDNMEVMCILEDDNVITQEFKVFIEDVKLENLPGELLLLGHQSHLRLSNVKGGEASFWSIKQEGIFKIKKPIEHPYSTIGYIIKKSAAEKLLTLAFPLRMPADYLTGSANAVGVELLLVTPPCIFPNTNFDKSTIQGDRSLVTDRIDLKFLKYLQRKKSIYYPFFQKTFFILKWLRLLPYKLEILKKRSSGY